MEKQGTLFISTSLLSEYLCESRLFLSNTHVLCLMTAGRHEIITKEVLELDPADNVWTGMERRAAMHDSYDVCLVANLNPRDLFSP